MEHRQGQRLLCCLTRVLRNERQRPRVQGETRAGQYLSMCPTRGPSSRLIHRAVVLTKTINDPSRDAVLDQLKFDKQPIRDPPSHITLGMSLQTQKVQVVRRPEKKPAPERTALGMDPSAGAAPIPFDPDSAAAGVRFGDQLLAILFFVYPWVTSEIWIRRRDISSYQSPPPRF